ncbi:MAG TPA: hypothetical protein VFX42_11585, partial [Gemmatimonadales bacterium]|nr:hypothetical protein [Gemmatimonadales bacterium]
EPEPDADRLKPSRWMAVPVADQLKSLSNEREPDGDQLKGFVNERGPEGGRALPAGDQALLSPITRRVTALCATLSAMKRTLTNRLLFLTIV